MTEEKFWWLSEFNLKPEVLGETHFPKRLKIYDVTLRDGEQTIGVAYDKSDKLQIARMLDELRVDRIEVGKSVSKEDKEAVEVVLKAGLKAEIWGLCSVVSAKGDIDGCIDAGLKHVTCEVATSPIKMQTNNLTPEGILEKTVDCLQYAKSRGLYAAFFAVDATRADSGFLETVFKKAVEKGGADEVVLVDTLGVGTPETMFYLIKKIREWVSVPVMFHCHNDFGMGTACAIASVKGGAHCVHVSVNGLGERTGNADLAEVVIAAHLYGIPVGIDLKKLYPAAILVEKITKTPISPLQPVVGKYVFQRETGATAAQLISFPPSVEPYSPELLGREREILLSKKSGKKSVEYKLEKLNLKVTPDQIDQIHKKVVELGLKKKGLVNDEEFRDIVKKVVKD